MPGSPVPARKTLSAEPLPEDAAVPAVGSQAAAHAETEAPGSGEALTDSRDFLYTRNLEREIKVSRARARASSKRDAAATQGAPGPAHAACAPCRAGPLAFVEARRAPGPPVCTRTHARTHARTHTRAPAGIVGVYHMLMLPPLCIDSCRRHAQTAPTLGGPEQSGGPEAQSTATHSKPVAVRVELGRTSGENGPREIRVPRRGQVSKATLSGRHAHAHARRHACMHAHNM